MSPLCSHLRSQDTLISVSYPTLLNHQFSSIPAEAIALMIDGCWSTNTCAVASGRRILTSYRVESSLSRAEDSIAFYSRVLLARIAKLEEHSIECSIREDRMSSVHLMNR